MLSCSCSARTGSSSWYALERVYIIYIYIFVCNLYGSYFRTEIENVADGLFLFLFCLLASCAVVLQRWVEASRQRLCGGCPVLLI